ncbi:putative methyltransferase YcgJ [Hartmannibacter diazotrophicus]|uniref:Putative methyltransferase YcgJ n=1 Tax=Hartmannibacter diazotrophicus TaxID=1482074 RepID=A0A2C9D068_9HYPH|nr:class I SAM-dependent methyltransferase [Hartmannibacter diazotrophicus]SON53722.1 putative methyltransferase YcgJ [Hartmannibacter diazotrophicus]
MKNQNQLIDAQFGERAAVYVTSAVHAAGADLERIAAVAAEVRPGFAIDLGTGGGHVAYGIAPFSGTVVACDLSSEMLAVVAETAAARGISNIETRACDVAALPFEDASADFVASRFSAHHWTDLDAALREARRVLKPEARAAFSDTMAPSTPLFDTHLQSIELLRDPSHVRNRTVAEWAASLAAAKLTVQAVSTGRIRLEFSSWIARMRTAESHVAAIRSLQASASKEVRDWLGLEADGSFCLDTAVFEVVAV